MAKEKTTTIPVSLEVGEIVAKLAAKKAAELKLPKLSQRDYTEMHFKELAELELVGEVQS
jgi:hypothetical protein